MPDRRQRTYRRTPSVTLRNGTLNDRFFIGSLSRRVFSVFGDYVGTLLNWLSHPGVITVIAEQHDIPVAFAMLRLRKDFFNSSVGELLAIAVIPERQRHGIGIILLRHVESVAMTQDIRELRLNTAEINTAACHFFRRAGFNVVGIKDHFYPAGQRALEMCKRLNPQIPG